MYIPKQFEVTELSEIKKFVSARSTADLVTVQSDGQPISTLMPVLWLEGNNEYGKLIMHMSRANQQWKSIQPNQKALAIVHGIEAYVSPTSYATKAETGKVVPTWNYTSVHLTGTLQLTEDDAELIEMVELLTKHHEAKEPKPWNVSDAPSEFTASQLKAIIGITMTITAIEAKAKLNQNRSQADRAGVIKTLSGSENLEAQEVARLMTAENDLPNRLI